ncbi:MAG: hypothetical protein Q3961_03845, partial [Bifidobacteriaceae bacterium]|nr:hypothetical protein [Bifidobacteriaceae bacterium]
MIRPAMLPMIDEYNYEQEMEEVVLPILQQCKISDRIASVTISDSTQKHIDENHEIKKPETPYLYYEYYDVQVFNKLR